MLPVLTKEQFLGLPVATQREYRKRKTREDEILRLRKIRTDLPAFAHYVDNDYTAAWFHKVVFEALEKIRTREITRLILELPPQHGKTRSASQIFPAFVFGHNPKEKIIAVSFDDYLATTNNKEVQRVMLTPEYKELFPSVTLNEKNVRTLTENPVRNSDVFDVVFNGSVAGRYSSTTVNGAISGRGFTVGIIDDPIKGAEAAQSPTQKQKAIDWYNAEFSRRKAPNAAIIIMTTRWADDDLVGYLLSTAKSNPKAEQWQVITLPGMYEPDRPQPYDIRTADGEGLWLDHYGQQHYETERESMDTYFWNALIQQRPSAREGNVFKRSWYLQPNGTPWRVPNLNGSLKSVVAYWDLAYSDNPNADQTSGALSLLDATNFEWVQEVHAGRWNIKDRNAEMLRTCLRWNSLFPRLPVWLESGMGAGVADVQELQRLLIANGINAMIDNVQGGKVVRANASTEIGSFMSASQSGIIHFCEGEWTEPTLYELSRLIYKETSSGVEFTGGKKDRLDSLVGAHRKLTNPRKTAGIA